MKLIEEYEIAALETAKYSEDLRLIYPTLGLNGEAGEVAEKVKKLYRDHGGVLTDDYKAEIVKEIGDVLWYCVATCRDIGVSLEDCMAMNISKLKSRNDRGKISGSGDNR